MDKQLTPEEIVDIIEESMFDCYPQWRNLTPSDLPIVAEKIASLINPAEDEPKPGDGWLCEKCTQELFNGETDNWISVEDSLPEKETECLVFESGYMHVTEFVGWDEIQWFNEHGSSNPTHWMPLPEPPKDN